MENKPESLLVVPLGKALNGIPPSSSGRQVTGGSTLTGQREEHLHTPWVTTISSHLLLLSICYNLPILVEIVFFCEVSKNLVGFQLVRVPSQIRCVTKSNSTYHIMTHEASWVMFGIGR